MYCGITISFADGTLGVLTMDGGGGIKYQAAQHSLSQVFPVYQGGDLNERTSTCIVQCFHDTGNMPVQAWGVCLVLRADIYISQMYINNYDTTSEQKRVWVRSFAIDENTWTSWRALQHSLSQKVGITNTMFKTIEVNIQPSYNRVTLHMKDGVMVTQRGTRYIRIQVNWYFSNSITIEGMREGSKNWEKIQQHSLSQLNDKSLFWGGLNKFDVGFFGTNDDFSLEFGFVSFIDNRKMILIFNKDGIELQFLNSDNTNRRTMWKMTAKQLSLSQINNGWWFKFNGDLFQDVLPLDIPYGLCIYIVYNKDVLTNQPGEGILFTMSYMGQMKEILTINNSYDVYVRWSNADLNQWRDWIKIVQYSLSRAPRLERKAKDVYFNESEAGYPMMSIETESDQFIITFGEALEWWRRSDGAYRRHPL